MKMCKQLILAFFLLFSSISISQENSWFYLRAKDTLFNPQFNKVNNKLIYIGNDIELKNILSKYTVSVFKKTYKNTTSKNLKKTFFVIANNDKLLIDLLKYASHFFEFGEVIEDEEKKIFEPNDYGLTSTISENVGLQVNLDYLDFLGVPKAWYYTTGSSEIKIGISDAYVDTTNIEFSYKSMLYRESTLSRGHGSAVASIAAAQGNNEYGTPGVCYDCDIYTTSYGDFKNFKQLIELSQAGVKVINCSWVGSKYYQTAQDVIDQLYKDGTLIVAGAGNKNWEQSKGNKVYYPASYNHVISVSSGMYKHETVKENILINNEKPYAENIRGYVGRTVGFKNHNVKNVHHIYPVSITTLNKEVDVLAPSTGVFLFNKYLLENKIIYDTKEHTSNATPFVTGTVGLMFSLNPCLPVDEVESIIKMAATNIDAIEANKPYAGMYGAGMLHTGRAVEMVYQLYTPTETCYIENQNFSRWNFKLTSLSEKTVIRNQKFTDSTSLKLTAKNQIVLGENTVLKPDNIGSISLKINPSLKKECELQLREGFPDTKYYKAPRN